MQPESLYEQKIIYRLNNPTFMDKCRRIIKNITGRGITSL